MSRRIVWLGVVLILCFAVLLIQLTNVQFGEAKKLSDSPRNPVNVAQKYQNYRGEVLAADGTLLAQSKPAPRGGDYKYYRYYPQGALYSGIVGYSSPYWGTAGVEESYDDALTPHAQPATTLEQLLSPPPKEPDSVVLTVEPYLQKVAAQALAADSDQYKDGAVVALDPRTGAVEAMYSTPNDNPNLLSAPDVATEIAAGQADFDRKDDEGFYPGRPMATFDAFPPGSTFKVVTSAAVYNLDQGLADFSALFPTGCTAPGQIPNTTKVVCNDSLSPPGTPCGGTMVQMLPQSCDPGYAMLGLSLGATDLAEQAKLFGWNRRPPIDLPSASVSSFPSVAAISPPNQPFLAYSAFGQGNVTATALQDAMVAEAIADGGSVMTPHVMAQIRNNQQVAVQTYKPHVYTQATSPAAAAEVSSLMQGVVTAPDGTANKVGFAPSLDAAVKTGTAQTTAPDGAPASDDWMIGFAPANNPVVAVAVIVPYQQSSTSGAEVAGPIMNAMLSAAVAHN